MAFFSKKNSSHKLAQLNYRRSIFSQAMSSTRFTLILSCIFVVFYNTAMIKALLPVIDHTVRGYLFGASTLLLVGLVTTLVLSLIVLPRIGKPLSICIIFCAAAASYFMNAYGIVIHSHMVQNTFETDIGEVRSLINNTLVFYIIILGVLPSIFIARARLQFGTFSQELIKKLKLWGVSCLAIVILIMCFFADYASFFRNEKHVRQLSNPLAFIYATGSYLLSSNKSFIVKPMGKDAVLNKFGQSLIKPTLLVLVVGETARADRFSINGYSRPTTPLLAKQNIINYGQVSSCGTETAISVPCMFSTLGRKHYTDKKAKSQEGLLDVINHSGYSVLWRDNNSGCKGACDRISYEDVSKKTLPELCNEDGCFDNILLQGIDSKIIEMRGNKVIVLHQKGSHGPEYFRRYPSDMEAFKPVCRVNKLQDCSSEELNNAFDNTIHYTDYFLHSTIEWLKSQDAYYNTALIYLSDHGESLGENNMYLHGMPYLIAPKEQKHIPFLFWFSDAFKTANQINSECLHAETDTEYSQDNLFHTMLGLLNINTSLYDPTLDMVRNCRQQ